MFIGKIEGRITRQRYEELVHASIALIDSLEAKGVNFINEWYKIREICDSIHTLEKGD